MSALYTVIVAYIFYLFKGFLQYTYVTDRKAHDMRYAIEPTKNHSELGWLPGSVFIIFV